MLGRFAEAALPSMNADELGKFEKLLAVPDPDVEKWLFYGPDGAEGDILEVVERVRAFHRAAT